MERQALALEPNSRSEERDSFAARFSAIEEAQTPPSPKAEMAYLVPTTAALAALPNLTLGDRLPKAAADPNEKSVVVVDKTKHNTHILQVQNGQLVEVLNVKDATGKGPRMTPEGRFNIIGKEMNPTWYPPPSMRAKHPHPVGPGPKNPLGEAKIRTDAQGGIILLHGTNRPDQIGMNASRGCVRHHNEDIKKIYPLVQTGDAVYIVKNYAGTKIQPYDFGRRR